MDTKQNTYYTGKPKFDLHLSAYDIAFSTVTALEKLGFVRDEFANNRYCDTTAYHGSFPNWEPNSELYLRIKDLLFNDSVFNGGLEEEVTLPWNRAKLTNVSDIRNEKTEVQLIEMLQEMPPTKSNSICPAGRHKTCDIHINVDWQYSYDVSKKAIDSLKLISFDKPHDKDDVGRSNFDRIYTMTFESLCEGISVFNGLAKTITPENGFGIQGKIKLEMTTRIFRKPCDGQMLPIILEL